MTQTDLPSPYSHLPVFLLDMPQPGLLEETRKALKEMLTEKQVTDHFEFSDAPMEDLPEDLKYDAIVSPANSYARLDGAFDHVISEMFAPEDDYHAITRACQSHLYRHWKGFAPPGTCTQIRIPPEIQNVNRFGAKWVMLCPTMRTPEDVRWDREVVYKCVWGILNSAWSWNEKVAEGKEPEGARIGKILLPGLGTGVGGISVKKFAYQTAFAFKHFLDTIDQPDKFSNMSWNEALKQANPVRQTYELYE